MAVAVIVIVWMIMVGSMRVVAMCAVGALYAMGALAVAVAAGWSRVVGVMEDVLRKGGRDWRQSVA